jgi:Fic-DOC domain mobile mystery protein B
MGLKLNYTAGQTPIDEDECVGLKIPTITTIAELNEFEQNNIELAIQWTLGRKIKVEDLLTEDFTKSLHKRMFGEVWKWAGIFRKSEKNIGIESWKIHTELRQLLEDAKYWIKNNSYAEDEIAIRFKHRLVSIHCFANGNGRHSRLMADLISEKVFNRNPFTWGQSLNFLSAESGERKAYLKALKRADKGDYAPLIKFARS